MLRNWKWLIVFGFVALTMPVWAQNSGNGAQNQRTPSSQLDAPSAQASAKQDPSYVIGPEDVLEVDVWKQKELTQTVEVRPDGKISLPLLNDIQASGLTPTELSAKITDRLKKFVTDPQVTVIVRQINSQRVYILGEVTRPGAYPLLPGMNVLQALASAGGFTMFANTKKIYVLRQVGTKQEKFEFNYKDVINGKHVQENIVLKAGDQVIVP